MARSDIGILAFKSIFGVGAVIRCRIARLDPLDKGPVRYERYFHVMRGVTTIDVVERCSA